MKGVTSEAAGADAGVRAQSEGPMRRVSRRNSSVLIIRPVQSAVPTGQQEFSGGIATATARLFTTVSEIRP